MDRLDRILAMVRREVPNFRLVHKKDVAWMQAWGRLVKPFADFDRFAVALGSSVYLPVPPEEFPREHLADLLAHEHVHQLDQKQWGVLFYASYGGCLPTWRTMRAHWERRAYAMDLLIARERGGEACVWEVRDRIVPLFAGPSYGWMWGGRTAAERYLAPVVEEVLTGRLEREAPYAELLGAWRDPTG